MSVELLDGATIRDFVEDESSFNGSVEGYFASLDTDSDGLLSYDEMARELENLRAHFGDGVDEVTPAPEELRRLYGSLFAQFDHDGDGTVDLEEFRSETKEMLLAVANGLGSVPVQMVLEEGSLLKMAVDRESAKIASS
ncbi:unnamed protein product [Spirodela intermedia]|uniref:EF-hand domain-containing protein n=2 Tax=Spirodela intermedia TaxID=51605 RepID=A0A7I8LD29_SPIIN|nr:unnamed protein product [Spirodela intermedia]CAA6670832.1 unnamed protein product [Spirodela intermedia]CAA7407923.1 unnamed protein product [Spirodela intermedia]